MKTILVVEDDADTRNTLVDLLGEQGFEVRDAEDGLEALRYLSDRTPDIALIDLVLPNMGGQALIAAMKLAPSFAAIPIVATSALARIPELPAGVEILRKPFDLEGLFRAITRALTGRDPVPARNAEPERTQCPPGSGVFRTPWPRPGLAKGVSGAHAAVERVASAARTGPPFRP